MGGKRYFVVSRTGEKVEVTAQVFTYARPPLEAGDWLRGYRSGIREGIEAFAGGTGVSHFLDHTEEAKQFLEERYSGKY